MNIGNTRAPLPRDEQRANHHWYDLGIKNGAAGGKLLERARRIFVVQPALPKQKPRHATTCRGFRGSSVLLSTLRERRFCSHESCRWPSLPGHGDAATSCHGSILRRSRTLRVHRSSCGNSIICAGRVSTAWCCAWAFLESRSRPLSSATARLLECQYLIQSTGPKMMETAAR